MAKAQIDLGVGGGDGAYKGSFTLDASSKTVPLPFEVTHLFLYRVSNDVNYQVTISYDKNISPTRQLRNYIASGTSGADTQTIPPSVTDCIQSINSSQFVYATSDVSNWGGEYEFIAIP